MFARAGPPARVVVDRLEEDLITKGDCDATLQRSLGPGSFNIREAVYVPVELTWHGPKINRGIPVATIGPPSVTREFLALAMLVDPYVRNLKGRLLRRLGGAPDDNCGKDENAAGRHDNKLRDPQ
jgi:hypothetical protein